MDRAEQATFLPSHPSLPFLVLISDVLDILYYI